MKKTQSWFLPNNVEEWVNAINTLNNDETLQIRLV